MKSSEVLIHTGNERAFREFVPMVTDIEDPTSSSTSDENCDQVDVNIEVPMDIWKQFWYEIVVEELLRLRDNIFMSHDEFQDLNMYDPDNADACVLSYAEDVADKTRSGLSPKGWKDTIRLYGTFPEVLFGKRQSFWRDMYNLKTLIKYPWTRLILFSLASISLMLFLFFFFFAIFYATNLIRGPVFDKLADDEHVSILVSNRASRSIFSFCLSRSKSQFTIALVMLTLFFFFFFLFLKKRDDMLFAILISAACIGCLLVGPYYLYTSLNKFVNGDEHAFNIRNRLVDGQVTKPYPQRNVKESGVGYDNLFREAAATEDDTQKFTEDGRLITSSDTILYVECKMLKESG
ncbi:uncharacterized protein MONOS_1476 [Monocercomonoides exilis]|uniref:uncharacterized protein n=1 Tax=Monocercomonoides exilis TaxID=2049356 RepID=UPI00355A7431|nr:hypothetical protein MONOS_1476 [Monocercomonoides exilis]|eukprot:MONOS_1476.1-p1 / transcript=MONOS_1476.1 / gene=MONOS_1476 / organism=Monocercomonoides_exilis_PA203 / gene_product=unspecified product / transcript_product=unspecified product / location=Mono_scaffold00026:95501-97055(+) / protein_length=349 / sequence_SO=supercontig / SO=protein_coding / is_pseudo=false